MEALAAALLLPLLVVRGWQTVKALTR